MLESSILPQPRNEGERHKYLQIPAVSLLKPFEDDLFKMVENTQFGRINSNMQKRLNEDAKKIPNEKRLLVKADKTHNLYAVTKEKYDKLMMDNITTSYKKA